MNDEVTISPALQATIDNEFNNVGSVEELMPLVLAIREYVGEAATFIRKQIEDDDAKH